MSMWMASDVVLHIHARRLGLWNFQVDAKRDDGADYEQGQGRTAGQRWSELSVGDAPIAISGLGV
jgi:hypothetical protein